jgi:mRNA interferase MazF
MPPLATPQRGEIWLADLDPTRGREQAGRRPVAIVSVGAFNQSKADLVVVLPLTSTRRDIPWHVAIEPPDGGVKNPSALMCEAIRSISKGRLLRRWGAVSAVVREEIEDRLRILLDL